MVFYSGEYILVGCEQPILRLYDLNTSQCFVGSVPTHHHQSDITCAKWSPDGKVQSLDSPLDPSQMTYWSLLFRTILTLDVCHLLCGWRH